MDHFPYVETISSHVQYRRYQKEQEGITEGDKGLNRHFCSLDFFFLNRFLSLETGFKRTNVTAVCVSDK